MSAFAIAMLLVMGPTGSVAAEHSLSLDEETKALFLRITDFAVEQGALSPETAASLQLLFDSNGWASAEASVILNQAASELASAPPIAEGDNGILEELELSVALKQQKPQPRRLHPDLPPLPTGGGGGGGGGGGSSCQKDCKTEHSWCYAECTLIYFACVAASSGWGALACFFLYLVCIAHCDEQYEICMRQCEDSDWSVATAAVDRRNAFLVHDVATVATGVDGMQFFSSQPTLILPR